MDKKSNNSLDFYALMAILLLTFVSGYLLFSEAYCIAAPWRFWLSLISFLVFLFITFALIISWALSFSLIDNKLKLLFGGFYVLGVVLLTGSTITNVMIYQRYNTIVISIVMLASATFGIISLSKSGVLNKKEIELKKEEVAGQTE